MKADKQNGGEEEPLTAFWSVCGFQLSVYRLHERIEFFQLKPSESKKENNIKMWNRIKIRDTSCSTSL